MIYVYNICVIGVFSYAIFWMGHSGWWFLMAAILLLSRETKSNG